MGGSAVKTDSTFARCTADDKEGMTRVWFGGCMEPVRCVLLRVRRMNVYHILTMISKEYIYS